MKLFTIGLLVCGIFSMIAGSLLATVAFTDAYDRCPGMQCSDAISAGWIFVLIALVGLTIAIAGYILGKRLSRVPVKLS